MTVAEALAVLRERGPDRAAERLQLRTEGPQQDRPHERQQPDEVEQRVIVQGI